MMLKNIAVNIQAAGPAAVLIVWIICFTALSIFGSGGLAGYAQSLLGMFGILLLLSLGQNVK